MRRSEAVKQIASLEFGTLDASECARLAAFEIKNGTMYTSRRAPAPDGPLDPRLGKQSNGEGFVLESTSTKI